ncbi:hypothetical protein ETAE_3091 [Edwardsiella piscicida]|uniref:Uncharacterized protein n=1 Tax=Edwardsiella piscicida TaxID=1263550 RepID=A0AAU8PNA8_EDWPI|nr:hypothetical protein ETAE_3091 [Edwardsiella tarda EIB202]
MGYPFQFRFPSHSLERLIQCVTQKYYQEKLDLEVKKYRLSIQLTS